MRARLLLRKFRAVCPNPRLGRDAQFRAVLQFDLRGCHRQPAQVEHRSPIRVNFVVLVGRSGGVKTGGLNAAAPPASCQLEHVRSTAGGSLHQETQGAT